MRQRNKKIVLVEQMLAYPNQIHTFVQHDEDNIPMKIYSEDKNQFGQLAEIFYEAIVSEPMINRSNTLIKNQNGSFLVLKDKGTKKSSETSDLTKRLQQKGLQGVNFSKKVNKPEKNQIFVHKKSVSTKFERNEQSFLSFRSVSFSSDKKQLSSKHLSTQSRCLSARKPNLADKQNTISDFAFSSASAKKIIKNIKYSVIPAKRMI